MGLGIPTLGSMQLFENQLGLHYDVGNILATGGSQPGGDTAIWFNGQPIWFNGSPILYTSA